MSISVIIDIVKVSFMVFFLRIRVKMVLGGC